MNSPPSGANQGPPVKLLSVSHETVYRAIYACKGRLPNMNSIDLLPPEVAARIVPGHGEGDLVKGAMNRSSVGT